MNICKKNLDITFGLFYTFKTGFPFSFLNLQIFSLALRIDMFVKVLTKVQIMIKAIVLKIGL